MDLSILKSRLKTGELAGWYLMCGEEDYLKKYYMNSLRAALVSDEAFAPFNHISFEGDDVDFGAIAEAIKSPPFMSEYKLIEWRFADIDGLKENEKKALEELFLLKEDYPCAIFAVMTTSDGLDVGTPKRPTKMLTRLSAGFEILNFPRSTDSQLIAWLKRHFDAEGVEVTVPVLNALLFRSGRSMEILNNEVIKLCAYAKANGKSSVTGEDVAEIASPSAESDAFALSNAVLDKNAERAFAALADLKGQRIEPPTVVAMLERVYSDLVSTSLLLDEGRGQADIEAILKFAPYKAKLYIGAAKKTGTQRLSASLSELCRIDASSKSGGFSGYGVIEMFITRNF